MRKNAPEKEREFCEIFDKLKGSSDPQYIAAKLADLEFEPKNEVIRRSDSNAAVQQPDSGLSMNIEPPSQQKNPTRQRYILAWLTWAFSTWLVGLMTVSYSLNMELQAVYEAMYIHKFLAVALFAFVYGVGYKELDTYSVIPWAVALGFAGSMLSAADISLTRYGVHANQVDHGLYSQAFYSYLIAIFLLILIAHKIGHSRGFRWSKK